jgi:Tfp pilus assembly protein PilX
MKAIITQNLYHQHGAATLLTALVLLIGITLVTLTTSKTVLVETQIGADNYRTSQAVAAANATMDYGVAYFSGNSALIATVALPATTGLDHNANLALDYTSAAPCYLNLSSGLCTGVATESAQMYYNNNIASCTTAANMKSALITATGFSDDRLGQRTITQCVGTIDIFGGNGPKQPLVARGDVGLTGNYNIINRYTDINIWSGGPVAIGSSASAATYVRTVGSSLSSFTTAQLMASTTANTTGPVSTRDTGAGVDIIASDPGLSALTGDQFFENFFFGTRTDLKNMAIAANTYYTGAAIASAAGKSGIIWIEGDASLSGINIGTLENPAIVIVNGNLDVASHPNIYGMLYVAGQMDAAGTPTVYGASVTEGNPVIMAAGGKTGANVVGHGTVNLVYTPATLDQSAAPILGTTAIISGSWRDW